MKCGKYEKTPQAKAAARAKKTIMQTYVTSLLSLMLCVTMFFGTTAAWFTSEVESTDNEIYVGILKVDLLKKIPADDNGNEWISLKTEDGSNVLVFDNKIKWEPNATTIETLKVKNWGDLSFQYRLNLIVSETNKQNTEMTDEVIQAIASQFEVYVRNETPTQETQTFEAAASIADLTEANGWVMVGTLEEVLNGKVVFDSAMTVDEVNKTVVNQETNATEKVYAEHTYSIALHMKSESTGMYEDSEGNNQTIMGKKLLLNVKLVATQNPAETDEFGNSDYDKTTEVINAEELKAAVEQGGNIILMNDIDLKDTQITVPVGIVTTLNLNGHNLTGAYSGTEHYAMFTVPNVASLSINGNGNVSATTGTQKDNRSLALFLNAGKLTINGGNYELTDSTADKSMIIATIVDNRTTSAACAAELTINGGVFTVSGTAKNLFRNYPQQGGTATLIINGGTFKANADKETYIWNQEASTYIGEIYFNGGTYDDKVVYEDYGNHEDIHIAEGVTIKAYSGNTD